ncbi:arylesterase [Arsenicibacter rosenii]|nr:arylesterase [Arsenicibacter rosenii]
MQKKAMPYLRWRQVVSGLTGAALVCTLLAGCNSKSSGDAETASGEKQASAPAATSSAAVAKKVIVFYGNSLAAGYGLDPSQAFPALIGKRIDSLGLPYKVVNAGLSGETSAGGKSRISWVLRQSADIFVLELGGNDGLRGLPLSSTRENLQAIMDTVRHKNPETTIVIAGMQIPPNLGTTYTKEFRELFKQLADKNNAILIPFLLEGVGGIPRLNQADGIHPTAEGHRMVAENVWKVLEPVVRKAETNP